MSNGDQTYRVAGLTMHKAVSPDFTGYWQRHINEMRIKAEARGSCRRRLRAEAAERQGRSRRRRGAPFRRWLGRTRFQGRHMEPRGVLPLFADGMLTRVWAYPGP